MLTGGGSFEGETVSHTLAFVITKEPDWNALPAKTPPSIRRLLRRCLEKDRKRRLPDIASAQMEIDDALTTSAPEVVVSPPAPERRLRERRARCRGCSAPLLRRHSDDSPGPVGAVANVSAAGCPCV